MEQGRRRKRLVGQPLNELNRTQGSRAEKRDFSLALGPDFKFWQHI